MTDLYPAAEAVLDAIHATYDVDDLKWPTDEQVAAAALRAAADQLMPSKQNYDEASHGFEIACLNGMTYASNELRCIAAELDPIAKDRH